MTGTRRKYAALTGLAVIATLAWFTLDPGRVRLVVMILLGGFAARIALTALARHDEPAKES
ncbi:MAG TPA: hypothetical protein VHX60_11945 [Acidobacteriaceae bacterium]|nr:hypothetical protein [Acidobacteriaceae bacterium]